MFGDTKKSTRRESHFFLVSMRAEPPYPHGLEQNLDRSYRIPPNLSLKLNCLVRHHNRLFLGIAKIRTRLNYLHSQQWLWMSVCFFFLSRILPFWGMNVWVVRRAQKKTSQHVVLWVHLTNIIRKVVISTWREQSYFSCFCDCPSLVLPLWLSTMHYSDILHSSFSWG